MTPAPMKPTPPKPRSPKTLTERQFTFTILPWLSMTVWGYNEDSARLSLLKYGAAALNRNISQEEKRNA